MPHKAAEVVVLCEDKAHDVFAKRFLKNYFVGKKKRIRVIPYPVDEGSGKKHVFDNLPDQAKALRSGPSSSVLLVVTDADQFSVGKVHEKLDNLSTRNSTNRKIVYIVPKWHIETWMAYLDGDTHVQEDDKETYEKRYKQIAESKVSPRLTDSLAKACIHNKALDAAPDSLKKSCEEFDNIRDVL